VKQKKAFGVLNEQRKQYREENKDKINERNRKCYEDNKNKFLERYSQYRKKINCISGSLICIDGKNKHIKTEKHISYINNNNN
jgi:hypothetical protein